MGICLLLACSRADNARDIEESFTLAPDDSQPFGGAVSHRIIEKVFPGLSVQTNPRAFDTWAQRQRKQSSLSDQHVYLLAAPSVQAWTQEAQEMKKFVERGNTLLVVTDRLNETFSELMALRIISAGPDLPFAPPGSMRSTWLQLSDTGIFTGKQFRYFYTPLLHHVSASARYQSAVVLAENESGEASALRVRMGRGQLIVVTNARSFSNYFLLSGNNFQYLLGLLAYLPAYPASITLDDFYHRHTNRPPEGRSVLSALLAIEALRWAFWILVVLALLWVGSNLRRRQRLIPVQAPNTNSTVQFVHTIAQLYYNKADHANIGRKITAYFTDHLRNRAYLPAQIAPQDWPGILQHKTALDIHEADTMARLMLRAQEEPGRFSEQDLWSLHLLARKAMQLNNTHSTPIQ
ncbi:MAG: hypothetical protein MUF29_09045 [Chitinophagaceae bacterium]|nr:hypothetical protein [Chitinophagaceae bacterium]